MAFSFLGGPRRPEDSDTFLSFNGGARRGLVTDVENQLGNGPRSPRRASHSATGVTPSHAQIATAQTTEVGGARVHRLGDGPPESARQCRYRSTRPHTGERRLWARLPRCQVAPFAHRGDASWPAARYGRHPAIQSARPKLRRYVMALSAAPSQTRPDGEIPKCSAVSDPGSPSSESPHSTSASGNAAGGLSVC